MKRDANSFLYITPAANAKPEIYNPLKVAEQITLDALKVGMRCMNRQPTARKREAVTGFVHKYGLLGLMTALPTTPYFMDYEAVYLFRNHFIKEEAMPTKDWLFPQLVADYLESIAAPIDSATFRQHFISSEQADQQKPERTERLPLEFLSLWET